MKGKLTVLMITAFVDVLGFAEDYAPSRAPSMTKTG
jgi:hypothetical protein